MSYVWESLWCDSFVTSTASQKRNSVTKNASQLVQGSSFRAVNQYFETLQELDLGSLLQGSLENVAQNELQIIVVGSESSGKSTILERLCNVLVLPRHQHTCTTMSIVIKLRNAGTPLPPELKVVRIEDGEVVDGPFLIAATGGDSRVL